MTKIIITDRVSSGCIRDGLVPDLISLRPLTRKEISFVRGKGIRRYYLPRLTVEESADFFRELDAFWDQVVRPFGSTDPFWRNVVSSKMQEWDRSAAYLSLILFTLSKRVSDKTGPIVLLCSSLEEEEVCASWGRNAGWDVRRSGSAPIPLWGRRVMQEARNLGRYLRMFSTALYKKGLSGKCELKPCSNNKNILISSLLYHGSLKGGLYSDPYFGDLHNALHDCDINTTYLCNYLSPFKRCAENVKKCTDASILAPYSILSWRELVSVGLRLFFRRLPSARATFNGCEFARLIKWNARRFDHYFNFDAEIFYRAVKKLCAGVYFDKLIQLYEGNVFERACIQAFREHGSSPVVGYSHAVVFPINLKIRLTKGERTTRPEPDLLVSTGTETKRLMTEVGRREPSRIYAACALRSIPLISDLGMGREDRKNILVAMDGVHSSVSVLDWLVEHAGHLNNYKVVLRGHPNVPVTGLLDQSFRQLPDNFCVSSNDLRADLENSVCVIYRQTSVGIQSLMNGIPVIHLDVDAPLACDPLMSIRSSKWVVHSPAELDIALQEIQHLGDEQKAGAVDAAQAYARNYFMPPDDENRVRYFV